MSPARLLALATLLIGCSSDAGDPIVWSHPAWRSAAASIPAADDPNKIPHIATARQTKHWSLLVLDAETGREVASHEVTTGESDSFVTVRALAPGQAVFWFTDTASTPKYWTWNATTAEFTSATFPTELWHARKWELLPLPRRGEMLLATVHEAKLHLHDVNGDGPAPIELPDFEEIGAHYYIDAGVASFEPGDPPHWSIFVHTSGNQGHASALVDLSYGETGWKPLAIDDKFADERLFATISAGSTEPVEPVPYRLRADTLRGRHMRSLRVSGPATRWSCFGGTCVALYAGLETVRVPGFALDDGDHDVLGEIRIVALDSLESRLAIPTRTWYPDVTIPSAGYVGETPGEVLYWMCDDGELTMRRRTLE